jgi:hypothetical protein
MESCQPPKADPFDLAATKVPLFFAITRLQLEGASARGDEIARFTPHENIDNTEGMALRRDAQGPALLYMTSDDNYNLVLQCTLLLMFEVEK